ncbi:MAG: amino acid ABC transporter ATP-binding protein [bacterium]
MISIKGLYKNINGKEILKNINLDIPAKKVLGLIGTSGSGKTSLLTCICGLNQFNKGKVSIDNCEYDTRIFKNKNESIWKLRQSVGMVFQHLYLFPHMTVLQNLIEAPIHVAKETKSQAEEEAMRLLTSVGMEDYFDSYPEELSGGEQQRVAICRALAMKPKVLLLDEPTSALDPQKSSDVRNLLRQYIDNGMTLIIVSHSIKFLSGIADLLAYMSKGEILSVGPIDQLLADPQIKEFLEMT